VQHDARYRDKEVRSIRQELLTADIRTQLPGLYANEAIGLSALARVKFVRGPLGLPVERALQFEPTSLEVLREHYEQHGWAL
jgi:hypothetical protein